ncbi:MAG: FG-GAP-like repeat-containing protein [Candidatus Eisenbacteria bacterium]
MQEPAHRASSPWSRRALLLTCFIAGVAAADAAHATLLFTKVTDASNPIVTDPGPDQQKYYGASWVDYDGDGDIDLFVDKDLLYRNDGGGAFTKITTSGIGSQQVTTQPFSMDGNSWADVDNDGDLDAFLVGEAGYLYRNAGGAFTAVQSGGIGNGFANRGWACAWADYDNDGYLDLVMALPDGFVPGPSDSNHLFHNDGPPRWNFTAVKGTPVTADTSSFTCPTWADYDDDGDQDLFIGSGPANGTVIPDYLFRNLLSETGHAGFARILDPPIGTDGQDGQVWNWIDYDNDGDLDAYLTNYAGVSGTGMANRLYRQESDGSFTAITGQTIVTDADVSLASTWNDFDNDGDLDCFVATDGPNPDRLYENNGNGTFTSVTTTPLTSTAFATRSATAGDYDNDGDVDLFVNAPTTRRALYRNETTGRHWLELRLTGTVSNRSSIGAKARAKAVIGGQSVWQRRDVSAQNQFQGQNELRQHFGLRDATLVDSLVVTWPSGRQLVLTHVGADQVLNLTEPTSAAVPIGERTSGSLEILKTWPQPFSAGARIQLRLPPNDRGVLVVHDATGRVIRRIEIEAGPSDRVLEWDGTDMHGRLAPAGIYALALEADGRIANGKLVRAR